LVATIPPENAQEKTMANGLIEATLERVAVSDSDFDQKCFERFFQMSEEGKSLMAHMDHVHRGKMMAEIYRLLLAEKLEEEADYLNWEAKNHETAYFVPKNLYPIFMEAFQVLVADTLGSTWSREESDALNARCNQIAQEIQSRYSA
jgi:hypothetical protein